MEKKDPKKLNMKNHAKDSVQPGWEESAFAQTIDGQMALMLKSAILSKHFIEAQAVSWSMIEELLLPRLIAWIAKVHKMNLSDDAYRMGVKSVNLLYLCISHDEDLYKNLEKARKQRNKIVHKLTSLGNKKEINMLAAKFTETNVLLQEDIMKRFSGEVLIPSINLYKNGWNDGLSSITKKLKEAISY